MKILKKIGIGCLAFVICFCSCFKFVSAYQYGFSERQLNEYQTNFGSFDISLINNSVTNQTFSLPTKLSGVDNVNFLDYDYLISGSSDIGIDVDIVTQTENNMKYNLTAYTRLNGLNTIVIDIYNYMAYFTGSNIIPNQMFNFIIDTSVVDYEQTFDFTLDFSILDPYNNNIEYVSNDQPVTMLTDDHQSWYYDFNRYFYDFIFNNYWFDGMVYLPHIRITLQHSTSLNSSNLFQLDFININASVGRYDSLVNELNNHYQSVQDEGLFRWLIRSVDTFLDFEIAPNITIGTVLSITIGLTLLFAILKIFFGG